MEKFTMQCCALISNAGNLEAAAPKPVIKPEARKRELSPEMENKPVQKPWSVFEDVYWI